MWVFGFGQVSAKANKRSHLSRTLIPVTLVKSAVRPPTGNGIEVAKATCRALASQSPKSIHLLPREGTNGYPDLDR